MKLTGAQIFVECLKEQGIDTIFGYPGGAVLNIYDALYDAQDSIKHILTSHEQGASHAADGYARATGKVGVCLATSGPGATNLVTGIATAYMDSVPMVAFTGQVSTDLLGKDSFQEVDITGITIPITKHNYIVKDVQSLQKTIREAFIIAASGRPGPVLVDICKDVTAALCEYAPLGKSAIDVLPEVDDRDISELSLLISECERPLFLAGGGVGISGASEELIKLSELVSMPVATTLMGMGSFPGSHENYTGMVGMHGTRTSNMAVSEADLIIAAGMRFSDRVISDSSKFGHRAKIVHIDIDPAELGKNLSVDMEIVGDVKQTLAKLLETYKGNKKGTWLAEIQSSCKNISNKKSQSETVTPKEILNTLYRLTDGDAIITTEVGQNQLWAAQHYIYDKPRTFISSGGLGTMGYGLGACIGAKVAHPDKKVINIAGDGSFRMNCNELATAVEYKLPIIICIMNNKVLGMVRQWQRLFYKGRYSSTSIDRGTDFVALAKAFGAEGIKVTKKDEIEAALVKALSSEKVPYVIDFDIDEDESVYPIVPPGKPITELIEE